MSKQVEGIRRMLLILNKLRQTRKYIPKMELVNYVNDKIVGYYGYNSISGRTIERDICDIGELFGIYIKFDRSRQGYYIEENVGSYEEQISELMMNFDLINSIEKDSNLSSFVLAEHHRPLYSKWLAPLVEAIKNTNPVDFSYVNYRNDNRINRYHVHPHYLKESNQRWYLLAFDGNNMKTFGIDRIRNLQVIKEETFVRNLDINVVELFKDCYGIWNDVNIPVEDVELRYDVLDGSFIKSAPIHSSQQIITDTDEEFRISLRLRITNDFIMELLSRSRSIEVIKPKSLRERIKTIYKEALLRNS